VCVNTSAREANDRGYDPLILEDCVASYFPEFQRVALDMIKAQGGIVGWVSDSTRFLAGLADAVAEKAGNGTGSKAAMAGAAMA
jgi:nicotinamidase-related amidase